MGAPIVAGVDTLSVLDPAEHVLDLVIVGGKARGLSTPETKRISLPE